MSSVNLNASYANFGELSPNNNSGEYSFDENYLPSSNGASDESGYCADTEFVPATSQQFPELGPEFYSDNYLDYDGSEVIPIYYPIPSYYQVYYGVSSVENNGTTFYHYYPFAVPIYCLPSELTTENIASFEVSGVNDPDDFTNEISENVNEDSLSSENISSSDVNSMSDHDDFTNEIFQNVNEDSYSDHITPSSNIPDDLTDLPGDSIFQEFIDNFTSCYDGASSSDQFNASTNNATDVNSDAPIQEYVDDFTAYYDEARDSSVLIPENNFIAEERKNDIKRKKDWLYLLSLSGKLSVTDHIPEVHVMPEILEEAEGVEISQEILESEESFEKVSWTDVIPEIDKSIGDQKNPNEDEIESSYANGAHKEKCQASGEEYDPWKDFFCTIDDPVFGIEACFNNAFEKESSYNDLDKKNFIGSSTCGKTFMILTRLNKQIQILPTIEEEEEPVVESENLHAMVQKTPVEINKEISTDLEEGCFKSKQRNAEKVENNCGLPEATTEVGTSEKPKKKKRFKGIRTFFSELRSCFRKRKDPPG